MDEPVLTFLTDLGRGPSHPVWVALASPVAVAFLVMAVLVEAIRRKRFLALVPLALACGASDLLVARVLKPFADRDRPCEVIPDRLVVGPCGSGGSMPSAHAANTAALAVAAASPALLVVSGLVGLSRVVAGQHWPTDILAGWGVGALVGSLVRGVASRRPGWT